MDQSLTATGDSRGLTRLFAALLGVLLLAAPGCAVRRDLGVSAGLERPIPAPGSEATWKSDEAFDDLPAVEAAIPADQVEVEDASAAPVGETYFEGPDPGLDEPFFEEDLASHGPGEDEVTESPLDTLAETTVPDLSPEALAAERILVTAEPPTFDIPIEINDRVLAWVDIYTERYRSFTQDSLSRGSSYMGMFREIFAEEGVPLDLIYMAHVESGYKTTAYSRARARGIFQFMAATARGFGLRVDYWVDERSDPEKSARAAARYMKKLHDEFGDWYLAFAAYNAGEGKIRRAIRKSGKTDFWDIARTSYIRRETKNHVPAILAATLISKEPHKYGLEYETRPPIEYDNIVVDGAADLRVIARCAGTDLDTMKQLNPALRRYQTPPGTKTQVRVPAGTATTTQAAFDAVPSAERLLYARHRVRRGDTLSTIARRYKTNVYAIQAANGMGRKTVIRVDQVLKIPTPATQQYAGKLDDEPAGDVLVYRVRSGDNLYKIARRYRTTPAAIAAASGISTQKVLQIGQRLKVVPGIKSAASARSAVRGEQEPVVAVRGKQEVDGDAPVVHTVRRGDTLWDIASAYRTTVNAICSLNKITPKSVLYPGARLTVGYR